MAKAKMIVKKRAVAAAKQRKPKLVIPKRQNRSLKSFTAWTNTLIRFLEKYPGAWVFFGLALVWQATTGLFNGFPHLPQIQPPTNGFVAAFFILLGGVCSISATMALLKRLKINLPTFSATAAVVLLLGVVAAGAGFKVQEEFNKQRYEQMKRELAIKAEQTIREHELESQKFAHERELEEARDRANAKREFETRELGPKVVSSSYNHLNKNYSIKIRQSIWNEHAGSNWIAVVHQTPEGEACDQFETESDIFIYRGGKIIARPEATTVSIPLSEAFWKQLRIGDMLEVHILAVPESTNIEGAKTLSELTGRGAKRLFGVQSDGRTVSIDGFSKKWVELLAGMVTDEQKTLLLEALRSGLLPVSNSGTQL